jgi:hypothetical protein
MSWKEVAYSLLIKSIKNGNITEKKSLGLLNKINYSTNAYVKKLVSQLTKSAFLKKKFLLKNIKTHDKREKEVDEFFKREEKLMKKDKQISL